MFDIPFSVFKRTNKKYYYVKFKDSNGNYSSPITTKQIDRQDAINIAWEWFHKGIPKKDKIISLSIEQKLKGDITKEESIYILEELKKKGLLKSYISPESSEAIDFIEYLIKFWDYDNSPYVKEKLRKKYSIHRKHCYDMTSKVKKYWKPLFDGYILGEITTQIFENFVDYLADQNIAMKTKNNTINAGKKAINWAAVKGYIKEDITKGVMLFSNEPEERLILSPEIVNKVFKAKWKNKMSKLANLLALITGCRAGEIKALQVKNIGIDYLHIQHSWGDYDKLKTTKTNKNKIVEIPPEISTILLNLASENPHGCKPDSFVFWNRYKPLEPMNSDLFLIHLREILINIGMSKEQTNTYTFHGWRHYFVAHMKEHIPDKLLQSESGHKSLKMLNHYANHRLSDDRLKIQQAKKEVFGDLIEFNNE